MDGGSLIAIILAGGQGNRMCQDVEKPLLEIEGMKMIDLVIDAVRGSTAEGLIVAVSPRTPQTKKYCEERGITLIETGGKGYHEDIALLLEVYPVFVSISSDIPFLNTSSIDKLIEAYNEESITGCVFVDEIPEGVTPSYCFEYNGRVCAAVGVNVVTKSESSRVLVFDDPLLTINVNTVKELEVAREYSRRMRKPQEDLKMCDR